MSGNESISDIAPQSPSCLRCLVVVKLAAQFLSSRKHTMAVATDFEQMISDFMSKSINLQISYLAGCWFLD